MSKSILDNLNKPFPRDEVKERLGGGRSFSYAEGHYIIRKLNEIYGQDGWSYTVQKLDKVYEGTLDRQSGKVYTASYTAQVQLMTRYYDNNGAAVYRADSDVGFGTGTDRQDPGAPHELATKGAITDGLKRCAKSLGDALGLALYDKEQTNVAESEPAPKAAVPKATHAPVMEDKNSAAVLLKSTSKAVIAKKLATVDTLREEMHNRYKVNSVDELNLTQIKEFTNHLKSLINA